MLCYDAMMKGESRCLVTVFDIISFGHSALVLTQRAVLYTSFGLGNQGVAAAGSHLSADEPNIKPLMLGIICRAI